MNNKSTPYFCLFELEVVSFKIRKQNTKIGNDPIPVKIWPIKANGNHGVTRVKTIPIRLMT